MSSHRRPSQPFCQDEATKPKLKRRSTVATHLGMTTSKPKPTSVRREPLVAAGELLSVSRRNKRNSVANAITVTGVTEALLVGELRLVTRKTRGDRKSMTYYRDLLYNYRIVQSNLRKTRRFLDEMSSLIVYRASLPGQDSGLRAAGGGSVLDHLLRHGHADLAGHLRQRDRPHLL